MSRKAKITSALLLTLAMCLSFAQIASADEPVEPVGITEAAVTKLLETPRGTSIPATMSFDFQVTSVSMNGGTEPADIADIPIIGVPDEAKAPFGIVTISFDDYTEADPGAATLTLYKESDSLFKIEKFLHAGVYEYRIKELPETYSGANSSLTEKMTWSEAEYTVKVFVREYEDDDELVKTGKAKAGDRYFFGISAIRTKTDDGISDGNGKVNPTPGSGGEGEGNEWAYSQMIFTNTYVKTNGPADPTNGEYTLAVGKTVANDPEGGAGFASQHKYFRYSMTVSAPELAVKTLNTGSSLPDYQGYVIDVDGTVVGESDLQNENMNNVASASVANETYGDYIVFTPGSMVEFSLKHGQKLYLSNVHVGAYYTIEENGAAGYIASARVTRGGVNDGTETASDSGMKLAIPHHGNKNLSSVLYVGDGDNRADFVNTFKAEVPAGLNLNDLPFYVLILLAATLLAAFIVLKSMKKRRTGYR